MLCFARPVGHFAFLFFTSTQQNILVFFLVFFSFVSTGLACAEKIKTEFDARWSPHWHVIIGRNFGSFVTHETKYFVFFYLGDKAVMLFKAG